MQKSSRHGKQKPEFPLLNPKEAARKNGSDFYAFYPLRKWNVVEGIRRHIELGDCGRLCSLRFCRLAPKSLAVEKTEFRNRMIPWFLDAALFLADSDPLELTFQKAPGKGNNVFGLLSFRSGVVAEFEINETLPDTMEAVHYVTANFTEGHVTNQPISGLFNEEGSILADAASCGRILIENMSLPEVRTELDLAVLRFNMALENGEIPPGPFHSKLIFDLLKGVWK